MFFALEIALQTIASEQSRTKVERYLDYILSHQQPRQVVAFPRIRAAESSQLLSSHLFPAVCAVAGLDRRITTILGLASRFCWVREHSIRCSCALS